MSGVVEIQFGYHVIKLTDKKAPRTVPLAEVSPRIGQFLTMRAQQLKAGEFVQQLRAKSKVEILMYPMIEVLAALADVLARGGRAALVTIVRASGSTPQRVGAKLLVREDGSTVGTIGGGCYENDAVLKARAALEGGRAQLVRYDLNDDFAEESGLICGGQMDVFIDPITPPPDLFVIGAGHVGQHDARLGHTVGFRVTVLDDREKFASREHFPAPISLVVDDIPRWLQSAPLPPTAYVVVVTRGHRHDLDALRALAARELRYLGLIYRPWAD